MRALILLLSAAVVGLSASILLARTETWDSGPLFHVQRFIADANPGEYVEYRDEGGNQIVWRVVTKVPGSREQSARIRIQQILRDRTGRELTELGALYEHRPSRHGMFPLMAPWEPDGLDRLWVWDRIRQETINFRGRDRVAWRVDAIDPALPPEGGGDHVVVWMDPEIPVFGMLRWQRAGRTFELTDWGPR